MSDARSDDKDIHRHSLSETTRWGVWSLTGYQSHKSGDLCASRLWTVVSSVLCLFICESQLGSGSSVLLSACVLTPHGVVGGRGGAGTDGCLGIILHEIAMENYLARIWFHLLLQHNLSS